jgi:hypothetical protein
MSVVESRDGVVVDVEVRIVVVLKRESILSVNTSKIYLYLNYINYSIIIKWVFLNFVFFFFILHHALFFSYIFCLSMEWW